jgi:hypothetical protein
MNCGTSSGKRAILLPAVVLTSLLLPTAARAEDFYYVVVFGSQRAPNWPRYSHTFATFVKATGAGPSPAAYRLESHTISWSPRTLDVRAARLLPEAGVNLDLHTTLRWAQSLGADVYQWGPFRIRKELYDRALAQIARLGSGAVQYKVIDAGYRPHRASNCIHAVSDLDADRGLLETGALHGEAASQRVALHLRRWMVEPSQVHAWVGARLGLGAYPITQRALEPLPADGRSWGRIPSRDSEQARSTEKAPPAGLAHPERGARPERRAQGFSGERPVVATSSRSTGVSGGAAIPRRTPPDLRATT